METVYEEPSEGDQQQGLPSLPYELRQLIFTFALVSPTPRWERLHGIHCKWKPRKLEECERPLFTFHNDDGKMICPCACGKRQAALGLLGTSRFIRAEAAPVFWSQNNFSFEDAETFVVDFAGGFTVMDNSKTRPRFPLPDEDRRLGDDQRPFLYASELIRHVRMFNNVAVERREASSEYWLSDFWPALPRLPTLRTLEVPPQWTVSSSAECVAALRTGLAHLESMSLCAYTPYRTCWGAEGWKIKRTVYDDGTDEPDHTVPRLWAKASRKIDLQAACHIDGLTEEAMRFGIDLVNGIEEAMLMPEPGDMGNLEEDAGDEESREGRDAGSIAPLVPRHLSEMLRCDGVASLKTEDGSITRLPLFGAPLREAQLAANEARRRRETVGAGVAAQVQSPYEPCNAELP